MKLAFTITLLTITTVSLTAQMWEEIGTTPFYIHHTNGFGYEGKGYAIEGDSDNLWEYNPNTNTWTQIGKFPGGVRGLAIGDEWDGKYYYGFGVDYSTGNYLNDLWVFDPEDLSFTQLPSCPGVGRTHPALIAYQDKVFVGTGSTGNGDISDWWEYDMLTQEWNQKPNMPGGPRHHPFFFESGDYVYAGGGHVSNWMEYDPVNEIWTPIDNAPAGRVAGTQLSYKGKGLLVAGDDTNHDHIPDSETFMMYDPAVGEWEYLPSLPNGSRWACSSFIIDDILYFFGGYSYTISTDVSMWKFDLSNLDCLPSSNLNVTGVEENSAVLFWQANQSAISDTLKWRTVGSSDWNIVAEANPFYQLTNLENCQEYEFQVVSVCSSGNSDSETYSFYTKGCGSCIDLGFCSVYDDLEGDEVYINKVEINGFANESGSDMGYGSYALPDAQAVNIGETFSFTLEAVPGNLNPDLEVWIDFNGDGNFGADEKVLEEDSPGPSFTTDILVPITAEVGVSRMRIVYARVVGPTSPCGDNNSVIFDGEAEDYCLQITDVTNTNDAFISDKNHIIAYPSPFEDVINLQTNLPTNVEYNARIVNVMGETLLQLDDLNLDEAIDLSTLTSSGLYFLILENEVASYSVKLIK
jgi:N-acetylneuraminic acid mutarotase